MRYGFAETAEIRCLARSTDVLRQRLTIAVARRRLELELSLLGDAGVYAALAAVAVTHALGLELPDAPSISLALSRAGEPGRLEVHELADGTVVLDDAYNSNPASEHMRVGEAVGQSGAAELVAVSGDARLFVAAAKSAGIAGEFAVDAEAALAAMRGRLRPGDVVLVKASRGVRCERVVAGLVGRGAA